MAQKLHAPFVVIVTLLIHTEDQGNTEYSGKMEMTWRHCTAIATINILKTPSAYIFKIGLLRNKYLSSTSLYLALGFSIFLLSTGMRSAGESEA